MPLTASLKTGRLGEFLIVQRVPMTDSRGVEMLVPVGAGDQEPESVTGRINRNEV